MKTQNSGSKKQSTNVREKFIFNQFKNVLPSSIEPLSLLFCAYEFRKQYDECGYNPNYKKN